MPTVDVVNEQNDKVGQADLPEDLFAGKVNEPLLHEAIVTWLRNRRSGTASTKGRSEVAGSSRKPWRQKGTGRARVGTIRSPLWVGGGVVFGPKPRNYRVNMPRKKKRAALKSALIHQMQEGNILVFEGISLEEPRTSRVAGLMQALGIDRQKVLVVVPEEEINFQKSSRNIAGLLVVTPEMLNPYLVLYHQKIVIFQGALPRIEEVFGS
jgi:large subunit ribosomal protein L4